MGDVTPVDSAFAFIENQDAIAVLTVTGSATGTYTGSDVTCLQARGGRFYVNFTSIFATTTVRVNIQTKDAISGLYANIASVSLDAQTTGNKNSLTIVHLYPGIGTSGGANETNQSETLGRTVRVVASITATASVSVGTGTFMTVSLAKLI